MPRVALSPDANSDLAKIWCYLAEETGSASTEDFVSTADRLLERIDAVFGSLAEHPFMGRVTSIHPNLRLFSAPPYLIFYRRMDDGIEVARVLHAAREITAEYFLQNAAAESESTP